MLVQFLIAIDQLINTLVHVDGDGFGMADETLSARAWRLKGKSSAWLYIDMLFFWQEAHCRSAYQSEMNRKQLPVEYQQQGEK